MAKWLAGVAFAIAVGAAAIGVPMLLASGTTTTGQTAGISLDADVSTRDVSTGGSFAGSVHARMSTQTTSSHTTGPGGVSGPGSPGGGKTTSTFSEIDVFGTVFDPHGNPVVFGFGSGTPTTITAASDLSSARLVATLDVTLRTSTGLLIGTFPMAVDLNFAAIGGLTTSRDVGHSRQQSPPARFDTKQVGSFVNAQATGSATVLGINFAADGSTFASISAFDSTFRSTN
jgi:hypothetical protein